MTNSKWLRSALLGGVAVSVMATGAQASELSDLKAQLEALQTQVNTIKATPRAALPEGAALLTASRGQGSLANFGNESRRDAANQSSDRGFTISINPTADLPAPVTEITVYGYAKLDFTWANETQDNYQRVFDMNQAHGNNEENRWNAHAAQSRFGIKAKTDTAIGQIRAVIEGDFYGSPYGTSSNFRQRQSYGEWDMTDVWTLQAGQTWHLGSLLPIGISTIDFTGPAGVTYSRSPLLALKYNSGPISARFGIGNPQRGNADYPNIGGAIQYTAGGGHEFIVTAEVADWDDSGNNTGRSGTGYSLQAGANVRLGEIATLTVGGGYGQGAISRYINQAGFGAFDANGNPTKMWGANVGVSVTVSEATTVNAAFGYSDHAESQGDAGASAGAGTCSGLRSSGCVTDVMTIHANILWRPVKQMRLGWEVEWGRNDYYAARSNSQVRAAFGAWFFF